MKNEVIETERDDDIETDEELLVSGRKECFNDFKKLLGRLNRMPSGFRAQTRVVHNWRRSGFWFS